MDSDQQENEVKLTKLPDDPEEALTILQKEYAELFGHYYRLYTHTTADFEKMRVLLVRAIESPRSETLSIINGIKDELEKQLPDMKKWVDETNEAFSIDLSKGNFISFHMS
ncbi:MAG: hypothetical protein P1Q69_07350 [Candidatus Thorarchaeota archaeon]|nr:hypothetical protein [Candidatus Thorarchaeota archaeon]